MGERYFMVIFTFLEAQDSNKLQQAITKARPLPIGKSEETHCAMHVAAIEILD